MEDFRSLLAPKERSGRLYVNHHYDFRFGVAMCFEKRFGVEREEASSEITLTLVAIEFFRRNCNLYGDSGLLFGFRVIVLGIKAAIFGTQPQS